MALSPKQEVINIEPHPAFANALVYVSAENQVRFLEKYSDTDITAIIDRVNTYIASKKAQGNKPNYQALYDKAFEEGWGLENKRNVDMCSIEGLNDKQLARAVHSKKFIADYNNLVS